MPVMKRLLHTDKALCPAKRLSQRTELFLLFLHLFFIRKIKMPAAAAFFKHRACRLLSFPIFSFQILIPILLYHAFFPSEASASLKKLLFCLHKKTPAKSGVIIIYHSDPSCEASLNQDPIPVPWHVPHLPH